MVDRSSSRARISHSKEFLTNLWPWFSRKQPQYFKISQILLVTNLCKNREWFLLIKYKPPRFLNPHLDFRNLIHVKMISHEEIPQTGSSIAAYHYLLFEYLCHRKRLLSRSLVTLTSDQMILDFMGFFGIMGKNGIKSFLRVGTLLWEILALLLLLSTTALHFSCQLVDY